MSLQQWANNGWLKRHQTSPAEIDNLLAIVERDLADAESGSISADWRFGIAYNAALKLCTILLNAEGYKAESTLQHYRTIQTLSLILGREKKADVDYLDACRLKRNTVEYDYVGGATDADARELVAFARELKTEVVNWLKLHHPVLVR